MSGSGLSRDAARAVCPPGLLPRLVPAPCAPVPPRLQQWSVGRMVRPLLPRAPPPPLLLRPAVGLAPPVAMFPQALRVLQQRPVRRMVRLLSPWAMLPRELPLVRLLLLLLRLGLLLVLVACLCALR
jgi:hypothetical protein